MNSFVIRHPGENNGIVKNVREDAITLAKELSKKHGSAQLSTSYEKLEFKDGKRVNFIPYTGDRPVPIRMKLPESGLQRLRLQCEDLIAEPGSLADLVFHDFSMDEPAVRSGDAQYWKKTYEYGQFDPDASRSASSIEKALLTVSSGYAFQVHLHLHDTGSITVTVIYGLI